MMVAVFLNELDNDANTEHVTCSEAGDVQSFSLKLVESVFLLQRKWVLDVQPFELNIGNTTKSYPAVNL